MFWRSLKLIVKINFTYIRGSIIRGSSSCTGNQEPPQAFLDRLACFQVVWASGDKLCPRSPFFKKGKPVCKTQYLSTGLFK